MRELASVSIAAACGICRTTLRRPQPAPFREPDMTTMKTLALAALTLSAASAVGAQTVRPVVGAALSGGGKTLVTVQMDNGDTQRVSSGGLLHFYGGLEYRENAESRLTIQATVGYHVDDTNADNGKVSFSRVPFELLAFWNQSHQWRFGGGLRKSGSAKLESSGAAASIGNFNMSTDLGAVAQAEYFFGDQASTYVRVVSERYKNGSLKGDSVSGDHIAIGMAYRF